MYQCDVAIPNNTLSSYYVLKLGWWFFIHYLYISPLSPFYS